MDQNSSRKLPEKQHHFLFYLFRADRNEHPMPPTRAEKLLQYVKQYRQKWGSDL